jgi:hypothetical protein
LQRLVLVALCLHRLLTTCSAAVELAMQVYLRWHLTSVLPVPTMFLLTPISMCRLLLRIIMERLALLLGLPREVCLVKLHRLSFAQAMLLVTNVKQRLTRWPLLLQCDRAPLLPTGISVRIIKLAVHTRLNLAWSAI